MSSYKDEVLTVLHKYTRGHDRTVLEKSYAAYRHLLVDDTYPTLEGLRNILEIQADIEPKAANAKPEDILDLRFVDDLKRSGFWRSLESRAKNFGASKTRAKNGCPDATTFHDKASVYE